jgi:16S rRNA G966 N2-methylase RsmD
MLTQSSFKPLRAMFDVDLELLIDRDAQQFYQQNKQEALDKLFFRYTKDSVNYARSIQLEARRRALKKLPDWSKNPEIIFPPKAFLEQASSQQTATYKANLIDFNTSADLTGGTGIDSWQLALKSKKHIYVESNPDLVQLAKHNFRTLKLNPITAENTTAERFMDSFSGKLDLIYIDPLRRAGGSRKVLLDEYSPNVVALQHALLQKATHVLIKVSPLADLTYLRRIFHPHVRAIYVVAVKNECKEVLVHLTKESYQEPKILTVNITNNSVEEFAFATFEESISPEYTDELGLHLFEPNAAVLKAGAFNSIATRFNLRKLHINSHLYTSTDVPVGFPGNVYKVIEQSAPFKLKGTYKRVSIATRNFPQSVASIRKKTRFIDGDEYKLFATTIGTKKAFIVCKKLVN